jgi:hypothetical protein
VAVLKPLSSAIAIGSGGPFGAEGPIIMTGGALGSLFAQMFQLSAAERKTLLVAGAAAGMTAVFGTPMAAVLLAVELLLFEWKPRSFIPVVVAAVVAAAWRAGRLLGVGPLFAYAGVPLLPWWGLGLCLLVGAVAGLQSGTAHRDALLGGGSVRQPAHSLDVVAGTWRGGGRRRRLARAGGAGRRLRHDRRTLIDGGFAPGMPTVLLPGRTRR